MVDFQTLSIVITGIGMIIALIYYSMTLQNTSKARQRNLVFQRLQGYSLEYTKTYVDVASYTDWESVEEFREKYGPRMNPEAHSKFIYIMRVYSLAGVLLKENIADVDLIFQLYPPGAVISIWEQFSPYILYNRERRNDPTRNEAFEYLYKEAKKRYPDVLPRSVEDN